MNIKEFPSIVKMMDEGLQKEIEYETKTWNERAWEKGSKYDRFPLSPSQIGKCGLALARNLAHYVGAANYPRSLTAITPRVQRIFARGHLLEAALIEDMEKYTKLKIKDRQERLILFPLSDKHSVEGNIDGVAVFGDVDGYRVLLDYKSKGAYYSANFTDSISQFFTQLQETGYVEVIDEGSFHITDPEALFKIISLDEFFVDYLLQLNAYGSAKKVNHVALFYENKNTCANYEVRWTPSAELYQYAKNKFQFIYDTTRNNGPEAVPKEFAMGSARCRLCEYNEMCWGKYTPKNGKVYGKISGELDHQLIHCVRDKLIVERIEEDVLAEMSKQDVTHIKTSLGLTYERKFLKSPKPHYELRLSK